MKEISWETLQTVKESLCNDCGGACSCPEQCEAFIHECEEMEEREVNNR